MKPPWATAVVTGAIVAVVSVGALASERIVDDVRVSKRRGVATAEISLGCGMRYQSHRAMNEGAELAVELSFTSSCSQLLRGVYSELYIPRGQDLGTIRDVEFNSTEPGRGWLIFRLRYPALFDVIQGANPGGLSVRIRPGVAANLAQPAESAARAPLRLNRGASAKAVSFVVQLATYRGEPPPLDALGNSQAPMLYEVELAINGTVWTALRAGFFGSEADARIWLDALPDEIFSQAFVAAAPAGERETAVALNLPEPAMLAGGSKMVADGSAMEPARVEALMLEAKQALRTGAYARSIQIFERLLEEPEIGHRKTAREFLGVARERSGQRAHARAEYRAYLAEFPQGPDAERVRQRLASLADAKVADAIPEQSISPAMSDSNWDFFSGFAQYYRRDVNQALQDQPSVVTQSALLSYGEFGFSRRGERFDLAGRLNGSYDYDLLSEPRSPGDTGSIFFAYLDITDQELDVRARVGRQTRYRDGILGRFDGAHVSWDWRPDVTFNVAAGLPVDSPRYLPSSRRQFLGGSVDWAGVADVWDFSVFANLQRVDGISDREAIGAEVQYRNGPWNLIGMADMDVSYSVLNSALFIGNWRANDRITLTGRFDVHAYPFLTTRNSLMGQPVTTVETLLQSFSEGQVRRLARDRTAQAQTAAMGISVALSERLQLNTDINYSTIDATVESGGVVAVPASEGQLYLSTSLIGSSVFKAGDTTIFTLRQSSTRSSDTSTLIFDARFPVSRGFRLSPRLAISYRDAVTGGTQWVAAPNFRAIYRWRRTHRFELEVGGQWSSTKQPVNEVLFLYGNDPTEESSAYYLNVGYWMDFG